MTARSDANREHDDTGYSARLTMNSKEHHQNEGRRDGKCKKKGDAQTWGIKRRSQYAK